ncbi:MAG: AraC family transcriptional regulator [Pseudomonadota bacterium]|nr:AraC family transcriptional regulator [Pseudomonadota bacterium]
MKKAEHGRQKIVALAEKYADNQPEYSQIENQDAFMIKASFPTYEGTTTPDSYFKLGMILQGEGIINVSTPGNSNTLHFHQGAMNITMPEQSAEVYSSPMNMLGICVDLQQFDSALIGGLDQGTLEEASQTVFEDPMVQSVMMALWQTSRGNDFSSLFFREGVELILNRVGKKLHARDSHINAINSSKVRLKRVHEFIAENLTEQICVADMAVEAGVGEAQFFNMCRKMTGMTPFAYLTHCRLQKAKQLLEQGGSVIETSLAVGYANPSKFSAAFRRHIGQSPSHWRKLNLT